MTSASPYQEPRSDLESRRLRDRPSALLWILWAIAGFGGWGVIVVTPLAYHGSFMWLPGKLLIIGWFSIGTTMAIRSTWRGHRYAIPALMANLGLAVLPIFSLYLFL